MKEEYYNKCFDLSPQTCNSHLANQILIPKNGWCNILRQKLNLPSLTKSVVDHFQAIKIYLRGKELGWRQPLYGKFNQIDFIFQLLQQTTCSYLSKFLWLLRPTKKKYHSFFFSKQYGYGTSKSENHIKLETNMNDVNCLSEENCPFDFFLRDRC